MVNWRLELFSRFFVFLSPFCFFRRVACSPYLVFLSASSSCAVSRPASTHLLRPSPLPRQHRLPLPRRRPPLPLLLIMSSSPILVWAFCLVSTAQAIHTVSPRSTIRVSRRRDSAASTNSTSPYDEKKKKNKNKNQSENKRLIFSVCSVRPLIIFLSRRRDSAASINSTLMRLIVSSFTDEVPS